MVDILNSKALEERVPFGTRSERVPQNEERGRNEIPFHQKGTEQERVPQNCKGTKKERFVPISFLFYQISSCFGHEY